jgi:hypothetical protein
MAYDLTYNVFAVDQFSITMGLFEKHLELIEKHMETVASSMDDWASKMKTFKENLGGFSLDFGSNMAKAYDTMLRNADVMEKYKKNFQGIVKFEALEKFSTTSPFDLGSIVDATKHLQELKFGANEMIPTLTQLGNVAAGSNSDIGRLADVYAHVGHVKQMSEANLRQFAAAGMDESVLKNFRGASPEAMFKSLGGNGGQYANAMADAMKDYGPAMNAFGRSLQDLSADFGTVIKEHLGVVTALNKITGALDRLDSGMTSFAEHYPNLATMGASIASVGALYTGYKALSPVLSKVFTLFAGAEKYANVSKVFLPDPTMFSVFTKNCGTAWQAIVKMRIAFMDFMLQNRSLSGMTQSIWTFGKTILTSGIASIKSMGQAMLVFGRTAISTGISAAMAWGPFLLTALAVGAAIAAMWIAIKRLREITPDETDYAKHNKMSVFKNFLGMSSLTPEAKALMNGTAAASSGHTRAHLAHAHAALHAPSAHTQAMLKKAHAAIHSPAAHAALHNATEHAQPIHSSDMGLIAKAESLLRIQVDTTLTVKDPGKLIHGTIVSTKIKPFNPDIGRNMPHINPA